MDSLTVVQFGPIVRHEGHYYQSGPYAALYDSLVKLFRSVHVVAGYLDSTEPSSRLSFEKPLASSLAIHTFPSNTSRTPLLTFAWHYVMAGCSVMRRGISRADGVLLFGPSMLSLIGIMWCRVLGKPFGFYWANDWETESRFRIRASWWRSVLNRASPYVISRFQLRLLSKALFVIAPSHEFRHRHSGRFRLLVQPVPLMKFGVEDAATRKERARQAPAVVLFAGELRKMKGVDHLVRAVIALNQGTTGPGERRVVLWIAGSGDEEQNLAQIAQAAGLADAVLFHGHVADREALSRLYRDADIFALPSLSEGFPRVLYEAMLFHLPIVTTPVGGIPFVLRDGESALFVKTESAPDLAEKIDALVRDPGRAERLAETAYALFLDRVVRFQEREHDLAHQLARLFTDGVAWR